MRGFSFEVLNAVSWSTFQKKCCSNLQLIKILLMFHIKSILLVKHKLQFVCQWAWETAVNVLFTVLPWAVKCKTTHKVRRMSPNFGKVDHKTSQGTLPDFDSGSVWNIAGNNGTMRSSNSELHVLGQKNLAMVAPRKMEKGQILPDIFIKMTTVWFVVPRILWRAVINHICCYHQ